MQDKKVVFSSIPWAEVQDVADEMIHSGMEKDQALDSLAAIIDDLVDFSPMGPVGQVIEVADEPVIRALLGLVVTFATDPERRAARKARREARRTKRMEKRQARKEARNAES